MKLFWWTKRKAKESKFNAEERNNALDNMDLLFDLYMTGEATKEERELTEKTAEIFMKSLKKGKCPQVTDKELEELGTTEREKLARRLGFEMPMPKRRRMMPHIMKQISIAAMVALTAGAGIYLIYSEGQKNAFKQIEAEAKAQAIYSTNEAVQKVVTEDGTVVSLNAQTTFGYNRATFNKKDRRVVMTEGEAFFEVAKNAQKKYLIDVGTYLIEVVGTSFNVSRYSALNKCVVSVVSGTVRVFRKDGDATKELALMTKNREISLNLNDVNGDYKIDEKDCAEVAGWQEGRLVLNDADAKELKFRLEQKYKVTVDLSKCMLHNKNMKLRASFDKDATLEEVMESLKSLYHIDYEIDGNRVTLFNGE